MAKNSLLQQYVKVFKLVYILSPETLVFTFLFAVSSVLLPYLNLLFLGQLINQISQGSAQGELVRLVSLFVSLVLVLSLLAHYFSKKRDEAEHNLTQMLSAQLTQRLLTIDYDALDDPAMRKEYQRAKEGSNYNGGLNSFVMLFLTGLFETVVAIAVSGGALVTLFLAKTTETSDLAQWTNSLWFALIVISLIVLPMVSAFLLSQGEVKVRIQMLEDMLDINRWFTYFTVMLRKLENAKILRLYQGEDFIIKHVKEYNQKTFRVINKIFLKVYRYSGSANFIVGVTMCLIYLSISLKRNQLQ